MRWLNEIIEEIKTPDKFKQYFSNLKFIGIPELKGKQPPNITESKILNQQLDDIIKTISNIDIVLDTQKVIFDELKEIREIYRERTISFKNDL